MKDQAQTINDICASHAHMEGPLLPILHAVQTEFGCIDTSAEQIIAQAMNLTRAEVHGVVSFYHDFLSAPDPRPTIEICRAEACKARGVDNLIPEAEKASAGRVRIKAVYCLGLCAAGPAARTGDDMHARLNSKRLIKLMEQL